MPDRWLVLSIRVPSTQLLDELAEGLVALGGTAVEEEMDLLTTYVAEPDDPERFLQAAADRLAEIAGGEPELVWRWQDDHDWARRWREGLAPRRVGRRIVVTQPWNPVDTSAGDVVIVVDPATAFGTGEHASTRGVLRLLENTVGGGERVLDVGTGSGILALAAVGLGAAQVLAVESDAGALSNARENLERNGAASRIELVNREVDASYLRETRDGGFDLVVANVLSGVLVPLLPAFAEALEPGGRLILAGILESEAEAVTGAGAAAGLTLEAEDLEEEWWSALFSRSGPR